MHSLEAATGIGRQSKFGQINLALLSSSFSPIPSLPHTRCVSLPLLLLLFLLLLRVVPVVLVVVVFFFFLFLVFLVSFVPFFSLASILRSSIHLHTDVSPSSGTCSRVHVHVYELERAFYTGCLRCSSIPAVDWILDIVVFQRGDQRRRFRKFWHSIPLCKDRLHSIERETLRKVKSSSTVTSSVILLDSTDVYKLKQSLQMKKRKSDVANRANDSRRTKTPRVRRDRTRAEIDIEGARVCVATLTCARACIHTPLRSTAFALS